MADRDLRLLDPNDAERDPPGELSPCRVSGCTAPAAAGLGFCSDCHRRYTRTAATRWRIVDVVCARLRAAGDPLFAVFGGRSSEAFGAHVVAHLEALDARHVHVPSAAVTDYLAELDERAREQA